MGLERTDRAVVHERGHDVIPQLNEAGHGLLGPLRIFAEVESLGF